MNFELKCNKLKSFLQEEKYISQTILILEQYTSIRSAIVLTEDVLPCILYVNICVLEKFIKLLLQEELNYNVEINTYDSFISLIKDHINNNMFESIEGQVGQWIFPISIEDQNNIGDFNFKGNQASKILENYKPLFTLCYYDSYRSQLWN